MAVKKAKRKVVKKEVETFPLNKLVEVEWEDANASGGWVDIQRVKHAASPLPCKSAGYLVDRTKTHILLALTQAVNDDVGSTMTIPTGWIKKVRELK